MILRANKEISERDNKGKSNKKNSITTKLVH